MILESLLTDFRLNNAVKIIDFNRDISANEPNVNQASVFFLEESSKKLMVSNH